MCILSQNCSGAENARKCKKNAGCTFSQTTSYYQPLHRLQSQLSTLSLPKPFLRPRFEGPRSSTASSSAAPRVESAKT